MISTNPLSLRKKFQSNVGDQLDFDKTSPCFIARQVVERGYLGQWFPDLKLLADAGGV